MFLVAEPICWGMEHVPFNAGLLRTIRLAFPAERVHFFGEKSHTEYVKEYIGPQFAHSIVWEPLVLPPRHAGFSSRLHADIRLIRCLLDKMNGNPLNHVLVITGNPSILWALKIFVNTVHGDKNVQIIFHGILSSLGSRRSLRPFRRYCDIRSSLSKFNHRRIQYIVLEESIRDAVVQCLSSLEDRIVVLDHPIPLDGNARKANDLSFPVQFGYLGLANEHKGFSKYLTVAREITSKYPGRAKFHVIGRVQNQYKNLRIPEIDFLGEKPGSERLSRDEYARHVNELHFTCLFFQDRHYEFSASGVLMDSIAWEKPVIASQLPIFRNIETAFGDIGYLCNNGSFSRTIETILTRTDSDHYRQQVLNMRKVKVSRSPESLAGKYRELVEILKHA